MREDETRKIVRENYAKIAKQKSSCCAPVTSCCGGTDRAQEISKKMGYTEEELGTVPEGANLGLGCGNPVALASLQEGETVLDLGAGAGFDCFLAAQRVGKSGKVIGVDMTPEMLEKARENAAKGGYQNVEFRLGEIENLPIADNNVDLIISNCVINLSPQKERVFAEAYRVLKPGGRLMVSDIVLVGDLPESIQKSVAAYISCLAGAARKETYLDSIKNAGFLDVKVIDETTFGIDFVSSDPTAKQILEEEKVSKEDLAKVGKTVRSIKVSATKSGK